MEKIKVIIIDDELMARQLLNGMIAENCENLEVLDLCPNLSEGVKSIRKNKPDLVFLDIEMPIHSGLELLDFFNEDEINFSIIFTTAHNHYAVKAFKLSAIDYLLKPLDPEAIIEAVERYIRTRSQKLDYAVLKSNLNQSSSKKLAVHTINSIRFLELDEIAFLKADGAYTQIILNNEERITSSRNLKNFETVLFDCSHFIRCHKSYIVNVNSISEYIKSDGGSLLINGKHEIGVSPDKTANLLKILSI
jgi:two-component system, LytTR family, response regulator